jgi:glycerol-3-phosphate O-acyltransferase/dihydroxyacetone phosphate acyltransferase
MSLSNRNAAAELREMRENLSEAVTAYVNENGSTAIEDFDINKFNAMPLKEKADSRGLLGSIELSPATITKWIDDKNLFNFSTESSDSE